MAQWLIQDYSIGGALQRLRKEKGLTQEEVATQMQLRGYSVSRATYAQMETAGHSIRVGELVALKNILKAEYADFFADLP